LGDTPGVEYKMNQASATAEPWIDANGWRFLRDPGRAWYYDVPERAAALAAAEAYAYRVDAAIHAGQGELGVFGRMLRFLGNLGGGELQVAANIGIIDDGKDVTGEVLNLLARRNLLFRVVKAPDPTLNLNVKIGSREYPESEAADPYEFAQKLRYQLTDDRRLVRIFGSNVVLVRLEAGGGRTRLHLLNYASRPVRGLRVRLLGQYRSYYFATAGAEEKAVLIDYGLREGGTEFTVPVIDTYVVVDLQ
jgi:hypothetical protein